MGSVPIPIPGASVPPFPFHPHSHPTPFPVVQSPFPPPPVPGCVPAGQVLSRGDMEAVLGLAAEEPLLLLADEVHQERCFDPARPFLSFRRVLGEAGAPLSRSVQLISFYSLSKGMAGGGFRAGFFDLVNVDRSVLKGFYTWGMSVYPPILGQAMLEVAMDTPKSPDSAYEAVQEHRRELCRALARNARRVQEVLGGTPGMRCPPLAGGPRAFPRIHIPPRARSCATALSLQPDRFFCRRLEELTGLAVTPGSHFRARGAPTWGCRCCCRRRGWSGSCSSSCASTPNSCGNSPPRGLPLAFPTPISPHPKSLSLPPKPHGEARGRKSLEGTWRPPGMG
ncbi:alanine aminotransferase 1-like [Myiozetetes cayanensis]|uniref:alanine aminotransferase 1-like n=1 Tax=Myiozetetes cayanensis TaxID=478635 RepID=UPI00215E3BDF|nr:alanine aminotransferase 1-like [Myiozetetes cayanensis]